MKKYFEVKLKTKKENLQVMNSIAIMCEIYIKQDWQLFKSLYFYINQKPSKFTLGRLLSYVTDKNVIYPSYPML